MSKIVWNRIESSLIGVCEWVRLIEGNAPVWKPEKRKNLGSWVPEKTIERDFEILSMSISNDFKFYTDLLKAFHKVPQNPCKFKIWKFINW